MKNVEKKKYDSASSCLISFKKFAKTVRGRHAYKQPSKSFLVFAKEVSRQNYEEMQLTCLVLNISLQIF